MAHSKRLQEVLDEPGGVLAGISGNKASIRVAVNGGEMSSATILRIKSGIYGEEENVRQVGRAYAAELVGKFRERIVADLGPPPAESESGWKEHAAQWLAYLANPRWGNPRASPVSTPMDQSGLADQIADRVMERIGEYVVERVSGAQRLLTLLGELEREFPGRVGVALHLSGGYANMTVERAEAVAQEIRASILEELEEEKETDS